MRHTSFLACLDCAHYIAGNDLDRPFTPETISRVAELAERFTLAAGEPSADFSHAQCEICLSRLGGARYEILGLPITPRLPTSLPEWSGNACSRRIYEAIGYPAGKLPSDFAGRFDIDGCTIEVVPSQGEKGHRVFLRAGCARIPIGRVAQTSFFLLSPHGGAPEGLYCRQVTETGFELYDVNFWENLDSSAIPTHGQYNVQSGLVSLDCYSHDDKRGALAYVGLSFAANGDILDHENGLVASKNTLNHSLVLVEALWAYGCKDVTADLSGNNLRKLVREAIAAL